VPPHGAVGAAIGLASAEWLLLGLGWMACRRAAFAVPVAVPAGGALLACVPMALAVSGLRDRLPFAVAVGGLTWAATLALALRLRPALARELIGGLPFSSGAVARES